MRLMNDLRTPLVDMRDISLSFGGIHAVDRASIDVYGGEVMAQSTDSAGSSARIVEASPWSKSGR